MTKPNHSIVSIKATELASKIDLSSISDMQCGMFKKTTLEQAQIMVVNGLATSSVALGHIDQETGKITLLRHPDVFTHMLALYFPKEMQLNVEHGKEYLEILEQEKEARDSYEVPVILYDSLEKAMIASTIV